MNIIRSTFIIFISVFMNLNVYAAPTFVDDFDVSGVTGTPTTVIFNPTGTKMYITGITGGRLAQYSLSTAFDITSTITLDVNQNISSREDRAQDAKFNSDGTIVLVLGTSGDGIDSWSLSTPYDINTMTVSDNTFTHLGGNPRGFDFNNDGTKMFVLQGAGRVDEYSLSTPYDPNTKGSAKSLTVPAGDSFHQGLKFSSDGKKMFAVRGALAGTPDNSQNNIMEYDLTKAFDISTATLNDIYTTSHSENEFIAGITFNKTGSKMYHVNFNVDEVRQYTLPCSYGVISCIDPTSDEDDVASVEVQSEVSKKLIQHTTFPVLNRMEWLRRNKNSNNLTNQNIKFQFSNEILASLSNLIMPTYLSSDNSSLTEPQFGNWSYWSEGTISIGKVGDSTTSSAKNINTSAITIGADRKNGKNKMYGFAFRFGSDDIDVGNLGSALDMNAFSLTVYETRPSGENMFMDSLIGISAISTGLLNNSGSISTDGEREGKQIFASIKFRETFTKEKLNITPNVKVDLGFTSLSDYTETGADGLNLKFDRQDIGTIITSIGSVIDNTIDINNGIIKPNIQLEYNADISPSSKQEFEYASNGTSYILENINSSTHNYRGSFGFDLITDNGLSLTTNYERNQSRGSGHTDAIYFAGSYVSKSDETYTFSLNGSETFNTKLDYKKNINGFDIKFSSNYSLMSAIPDYGATIEVLSTF